MSARVVFRADGGPAIGGGHITRCLALASAFSAGGWKIGFAATAESFKSIPALDTALFENQVMNGDSTSELAQLVAKWPEGCDLLVVDHYGRDAAFEGACRSWARRILVIDDLFDRPHDCDVLIDSGAQSSEVYAGRVPSGCSVLTGPDYALVHPAFVLAREVALPRRDGRSVSRILVSLGQMDPDNATALALDAIELVGFSGAVDVVLGQSAPHLSAIRRRAKNRISLYVNATNMPALMATSDLAIGAGGVTAFERCCLGLPSVLLELAGNQRQIIASIAAAKAGVNAGLLASLTPSLVVEHLKQLLESSEARREMSISASNLVDGKGINRITNSIEQGAQISGEK